MPLRLLNMSVGQRTKFFKNFSTLDEVMNYAQLYGEVEECFLVQVFAELGDIDATETEDIWSVGGTRPKPGDAERFNIVSTSANDVSGGTGARLVYIEGLDTDYNIQTEYVAMNGVSNVLTAGTWRHIHRLLTATVGSVGGNVGTVTATGATSSNVMCAIPIGYNISQLSHYMVPAGYTGYIMSDAHSVYRSSGTGTREAEITLWIQIPGFASFRTFIHGTSSASHNNEYKAGIVVREKSLIWMSAQADTNNTAVSTQMEILMINKDWVRNP